MTRSLNNKTTAKEKLMEDPKKTVRKTHPLDQSDKPETVESSVILENEKLKKEISALNSRLLEAETEAATNLDGWQRERAEFSNYKKRIERDHQLSKQDITGTIIKKYLVILDDLELALKNRPKDAAGSAWANGIELIARKLYSILEGEGVEFICKNKLQFDPTIHEAISNEENADFESGEVIEVVRQGYKLGDRTLRPAMVRVAR
jgi:molecular chaperone GrpE